MNFKNKGGFVLNVYLLLAVQMAITSMVVGLLRKNQELYQRLSKSFLLWIILSFGVLLLMTLAPLPTFFRIVLFTIFSMILGLLSIAASSRIGDTVIRSALYSVLGVFVSMSLLGYALASAGIDIGFLGFGLLMALLGLIVATLITTFVIPVTEETKKTIVIITIVLFSIFVAFDTNQMLTRQNPSVVHTAVGLYLDLLNLFTSFIRLGTGE
jgi:modulator of FtsH protease